MSSSRLRRLELLLLLGGLAAMGPAAMDTFVPALPSLARNLDVSPTATQLTMTTLLAGLAVGQIVAGPISDVLGRKRPLLIGIFLYIGASIVCAMAWTVEVLVAARFVQGCAAATGIVLSRAIVKDLHEGQEVAHYFSRMFVVIGAVQIAAPVIGTQLLSLTTWRGIFVAVAGFGVALACVAFRLPETLPSDRRRPGSVDRTAETFGLLLRDRTFCGYTISLACKTGAMVTLLAGAPFLVQEVYGRSAQAYGFLFLAGAVAMVVATQLSTTLLRASSARVLLLLGLAGSSLAGFALITTARFGLHVFVPCFVVLFASWGWAATNAPALALYEHAAVAGSASALMGLMQYAVAALAAPLVGLAGGTESATPLALLLVCFAGAAFLVSCLTARGERKREGFALAAAPPLAVVADQPPTAPLR
jgi:MFS transporter, DHA1 family, multidrug resistance protein